MSSSTGSSFSVGTCRLWLKPKSLRGALTRFATEFRAFDNTRSGNGPMKMRIRVCLPEGCVDSGGRVGAMFMARQEKYVAYDLTTRLYMVIWGMYNSPRLTS